MDNLNINPRINKALRKANICDFESVLSQSGSALARSTGLSANDIAALQIAVAKAVYPAASVTALQLLEGKCQSELKTRYLSTGCEVLNSFLRGGLLCGTVTEIAGESASGKTQLCLQLSLQASLGTEHGGLEAGTVYICTEDVFPTRRLQQMTHHFKTQYATDSSAQKAHNPTDHIYIEHAADLVDLEACINTKVPVLLSQQRIGLVIIDSIAAIFRSEFSAKQSMQRARHLVAISGKLHSLAAKFNIPIVCVNQVSSSMKDSLTPGRSVVPALGLAWANQVTSRLMLARTSRVVTQQSHTGQPVQNPIRSMEVMFAPHLPPSLCYFIVNQRGIQGLR